MSKKVIPAITKEQLLDTALILASEHGWESLTLADIANNMRITLIDIYPLIKQKDDLAECLFDRADRRMLAETKHHDFRLASSQDRLLFLINAWLDTLRPYRPVVREILCYKLEPGHIHFQVLGLLRISRTVQWMMHAASLKFTGLRRIAEEIILTNIYLASFSYWLIISPDDNRIQRFLGKALWRYH